MIPESTVRTLLRRDPELAGAAYLKMASIQPGRRPDSKRVLLCLKIDEWERRERWHELEQPELVCERRDLEHERREAARLEMLREIAVALADAPAKLRKDWERLVECARMLDRNPQGGVAWLPPGMTKSRAFQVRRQIRKRLGLAEDSPRNW